MSRKSLSLRASAIKSMPWFHAVFVESKVLLQGAQFFQLEFDRILLCQNLGRVLERSIYDEGLSELCFEAPTMWHERLFSWKPKWKKSSCIPWGPAARSLQESDKDKLQKLQKGEAVPEDRLDGPQVWRWPLHGQELRFDAVYFSGSLTVCHLFLSKHQQTTFWVCWLWRLRT